MNAPPPSSPPPPPLPPPLYHEQTIEAFEANFEKNLLKDWEQTKKAIFESLSHHRGFASQEKTSSVGSGLKGVAVCQICGRNALTM